mmetsp:Transcript_29801/g.53577  ORF Transcript_29801/g.53577 Transcript_29801/m.53577 type:complete len:128 (-) Transcript_29801:894-1277(-)
MGGGGCQHMPLSVCSTQHCLGANDPWRAVHFEECPKRRACRQCTVRGTEELVPTTQANQEKGQGWIQKEREVSNAVWRVKRPTRGDGEGQARADEEQWELLEPPTLKGTKCKISPPGKSDCSAHSGR